MIPRRAAFLILHTMMPIGMRPFDASTFPGFHVVNPGHGGRQGCGISRYGDRETPAKEKKKKKEAGPSQDRSKRP